MLDWLKQNWLLIVVPLLVFFATYIVGLWARRTAFRAFERWVEKSNWEGYRLIIEATRTPFLHWFLILGTFIAIHVSALQSAQKALADKVLASLFIISVTWVCITLSDRLLRLYIDRVPRLHPSQALIVNATRITLAVLGVLILLDTWGAPTTPIVVLLAVAILVAALSFRDTLMNFISGLQLAQSEQIKVGDYIKLETGESGHVVDINWKSTHIRSLDGNLIIVPNSRLLQSSVTNYGRPLKKASRPFRFYTRLHLKELTGLKASSLAELATMITQVPESVIYYHTHNFLEEHHFLTPEPANDFALWVSDELGCEVLGEKLASIDTFDFPTISALRTRIASMINEHLSQYPDGQKARPGREFHFVKSLSFVLPTPYIAHDLREFVEILKQVSLESLFYHMFESRLRLKRGVNDFSIWIEECLGDKDLADRLANLDPYNYTLDNLRSTIVQLIEKRIK